jgi:hypothetical protein
MDFVWAVVYPLQGKRWYLRLPLLTAAVLIPIVGVVIGFGYVVTIVRRIAEGDYEPPAFALHLSEGAYILGSAIVHSLVWLVIGASLDYIVKPLHLRDVTWGHLLSLITVPIVLHFFISGVRYALTDEPGALFDVKHNFLMIWRNKWRVLQSIIHAILYVCASAVVMFMAAFAVISLLNIPDFDDGEGTIFQFAAFMAVFLITFFGMPVCGAGYLLGQLARRMDLSDEKAKRKNDPLKHA